MNRKMYKIVALLLLAVVAPQVAAAESWRIHNDAAKGAHFTSINAAMASEAVKDGDVIYLDAGCILSDDQTISKAVTVIGTGWNFTDRPYAAARLAKKLYITAQATVSGLYVVGTIYPQCSNVVIERCRIDGGVQQRDTKITAQNVVIRQCTLNKNIQGAGKTATQTSGWKIYNCQVYESSTNSGAICDLNRVEIVNNLLRYNYYWNSYSYNVIQNVEDAVIKNNIILHQCNNKEYYKNYVIDDATNLQVYNNVLSADSTSSSLYAKYPNNVCVGSNVSTDFVVNTGNGGEWMRLSEGSPAKGAGEGGVDCGPYAEGSLYPFVTYGMPQYVNYPLKASVSARPTNDQVTVKLHIVKQQE